MSSNYLQAQVTPTPGTMEHGSSTVVLTSGVNPSTDHSTSSLLNGFDVSMSSSNSRIIAFALSGNGAGSNQTASGSEAALFFGGDSSGNTNSSTLKTDSGNEVGITSFDFAYEYNTAPISRTFVISGKKDGVEVGTKTITPAHNTLTNVNLASPTTGSFTDIDELVITPDVGFPGGWTLDTIIVTAAAPATTTPTVTTTAASSIANTSATLAGNVTSDGGDTVTERGIVYSITSTNSNPEIGGTGVTKDTNSSGIGTFSESIIGLSAGTQYSFKAYATNSNGTSYGAVSTFTTTGKGWTGATDTDWATASNWSPNSVPIASDNLVIPNVTNKPVISATTGAVANNITVELGSSLTINSGGSLIISGTSSGNITYQRTINFVSGALNGWYLMASPVSGQSYNDSFVFLNNIALGSGSNRGVASYTTASDSWSYLQSGGSGSFNNGQGYSIKRASTGTVNFTGSLNTSNTGVDVVLTTTGNRFNLLGNPYTSYVNSATFLNNEGAISDNKTIWVWNQTLGTNGMYETKVISDAFVVAPAQGFFVQANAAGGTFNFAESNQSSSGTDTFQRNNLNQFQLFITNGTIKNYAKFYYLDNATEGFDNGYDGELFGGAPANFAVYSNLIADNEGKKYQTQSLPNNNFENMIVPVGLNVNANEEITFSLENANLPSDIRVYIEDRETNTFNRIDEPNSNYKFIASEALNGSGRFYLHTSRGVLDVKDVVLENVKVYKKDNNTLRIAGVTNTDVSVAIYNVLGKQILQTSFNSKTIKDIPLPEVSSGVYLVQLTTNKGKLSKKIILN